MEGQVLVEGRVIVEGQVLVEGRVIVEGTALSLQTPGALCMNRDYDRSL